MFCRIVEKDEIHLLRSPHVVLVQIIDEDIFKLFLVHYFIIDTIHLVGPDLHEISKYDPFALVRIGEDFIRRGADFSERVAKEVTIFRRGQSVVEDAETFVVV